MWAGYRACIDYELFPHPVPFPYGKKNQNPGPAPWRMTDHCQFDTYKRIATPCHPVDEVEGSKVCHDIMMNDFSSGSTGNKIFCGKIRSVFDEDESIKCENTIRDTNKNISVLTYIREKEFKNMMSIMVSL